MRLVSFDPDWSPMGAAIRRAFVANGLEYRLDCQVPFSSTVCHMVSACGGIGIIYALTAQSTLTLNLSVRSIQSVPPLPLCVFHRRDKPLTARTQEVLLALKKL
ncbi:LysR substrate-binding domain-containing protein [Roseinatronobacter sp. HJB301]|uniref:LysR substrate-binding domain-containing protein n=1 Tax=Roseinatronobacter alkalisoli TaxID=3028235 RepID=A0ABT5TBH2_9RHOB|nr:LysR substrate-binding domain-containing protein [Roseinatronobacter sp. HJB301]MDD7972035.1 LysR substrate-binding domain-containing protein [Roseinatronobacter sp. HJB301]